MEPQIVFEDEFLLVIDKPSGMVVNRADTTAKIETVQDWTEKYLKLEMGSEKLEISPQKNLTSISSFSPLMSHFSDFYQRAGIVHRLDKETSGLLLIAKTPEAFVNLQAQFKNREVKKKYLSLVHGKVIPEVGEINAPVGRLPWNRERFGVMSGGKEAVTKYKAIVFTGEDEKWVVSRGWENWVGKNLPQLILTTKPTTHNPQLTLLELLPQTGRTHQIRIHLQYLGFPIVGDTFYAGRKQALLDRKFCPRVFLHASYISFAHPVTHEKLEFNLSLPDDLNNILQALTK